MHGKQEARGQGFRQGIGISIWRWQPRLPSNWWAAVESLFYANVARVLKLEASRLTTEDRRPNTDDSRQHGRTRVAHQLFRICYTWHI